MKSLLLSILLLITTSPLYAQTNLSLVKSINTGATTSAYVMLPGEVEVKEWDESFIRITTSITIDNIKESTSKYLVKAGRYSFAVKTDKFEQHFAISLPNLKHKIVISGTPIEETYLFEICVPRGYKITITPQKETTISSTGIQ